MSLLSDFSLKRLESKLAKAELPPSSCGLLSAYCVCEALDVPYDIFRCHRKFINHRAHGASVGAYLLSRYQAGMTAKTLQEAVEEISQKSACCRFFGTCGVSGHEILLFIRNWLEQRVVIVLTLNLQGLDTIETREDELADAWHHHLVGGTWGEVSLRMIYPDVAYSPEELENVLNTDSVLLIKECDILFLTTSDSAALEARCERDYTDLSALATHPDEGWRKFQVHERLAELLDRFGKEKSRPGSPGDPLLNPCTRIKIPAAYTPGITVFARRDDSETVHLLNACDSLEAGGV